MSLAIPGPVLARVGELVAAHAGLVIAQRRWPALQRALGAAAHELGEVDAATLATRLLARPDDAVALQALVQHVVIGETRFFRDRGVFDTIATRVLAPLVTARAGRQRQLRLWSAACSTGEETYTLAMLAERASGPRGRFRVLGTDISERALAVAQRGVYPERALREAPEWALRGGVEAAGKGHRRVLPRLRQSVTFAPLNLAEPDYPTPASGTTAMDLVLCRNVLMYLEPGVAAAVVRRLRRALNPGGWLVVSAVESGMALFREFERVPTADGVLFRRPAAEPLTCDVPAVAICNAHEMQAATPAPARVSVGADDAYREQAAGPRDGATSAAWRARALADSGQLEAALACVDDALAARPLDPELHLLQAMVSRQRGRSEIALSCLRRALFLDPSLAVAEYLCAQINLDLGRMDEARRHLRNAHALLARVPESALVAGSDGMTAGRLMQLVAAGGASS